MPLKLKRMGLFLFLKKIKLQKLMSTKLRVYFFDISQDALFVERNKKRVAILIF